MIDTCILRCSTHASVRISQRNLSATEVDYVRRFGKSLHRTGVTFYVLRRRDIPRDDRRLDRYAKLEGAVVLVGQDEVITVYRNRAAYRQVRKKHKYRLPDAA